MKVITSLKSYNKFLEILINYINLAKFTHFLNNLHNFN